VRDSRRLRNLTTERFDGKELFAEAHAGEQTASLSRLIAPQLDRKLVNERARMEAIFLTYAKNWS
jgi:hypothetical protein